MVPRPSGGSPPTDEPSGLYITHLFVDDQIVLSPDWLENTIPLELPSLEHLSLFVLLQQI